MFFPKLSRIASSPVIGIADHQDIQRAVAVMSHHNIRDVVVTGEAGPRMITSRELMALRLEDVDFSTPLAWRHSARQRYKSVETASESDHPGFVIKLEDQTPYKRRLSGGHAAPESRQGASEQSCKHGSVAPATSVQEPNNRMP